MLINKALILLSLLLTAVLVAGCGAAQAGQQTASADEHHEEAADEHHEEDIDHEHAEAPQEFEAMDNPLAGDEEAIAAGQAIFAESCATCHGSEGEGDGPGAETLDPQPVSLANAAMMQDLSDGYLYWRISEGGQMEPFNSAMPAWNDGLSEQEIWQSISYIRTLSNGHMDKAAADEHHEEGDDEHHEGAAEDEEHREDSVQGDEHHEDAAGDEEHHEEAAEDDEHHEEATEDEEHHE